MSVFNKVLFFEPMLYLIICLFNLLEIVRFTAQTVIELSTNIVLRDEDLAYLLGFASVAR
jgi:hypothetical protein